MNENITPNYDAAPQHMPVLVGRALEWLDKMGIPYSYASTGNFWIFEYRGLTKFLMNDTADDELALYAPAFIDAPEWLRNAESYRHTFDFTVDYLHEINHDFEFLHVADEFCVVSRRWVSTHPKLRLYKRHFVEFLKIIHQAQIDFGICLNGSLEVLFGVPREVIE